MDDGKTDVTSAVPVNENGLKIALSNAGPTKEVSLIRLDGVVDTMTAGELERVISSLMARGRYRLILDLAGVEYISSAGWGIFVSCLREIREHAGDVKLARMSGEVREIYELLEFDELLPSYEGLDAAQADFYRGGTGLSVDKLPGKDVASPGETPAETRPEAEPPPKVLPSAVTTIDQAVQRLVAEDPFYTIAEIRDQLRELYDGQFRTDWWKVFACLRRHRLLSRRARFRFFRRARKTAV